ncbi:hypothetical protein Taro_022456 [Colocasia esculenta]|uniref:Uncharacterized protein n=1 Tax=Colocasia esculenta TaxID=4460 RepID=A0A843V3U8_COLES|nr:hypothetical protein [Colocasia esculenta]
MNHTLKRTGTTWSDVLSTLASYYYVSVVVVRNRPGLIQLGLGKNQPGIGRIGHGRSDLELADPANPGKLALDFMVPTLRKPNPTEGTPLILATAAKPLGPLQQTPAREHPPPPVGTRKVLGQTKANFKLLEMAVTYGPLVVNDHARFPSNYLVLPEVLLESGSVSLVLRPDFSELCPIRGAIFKTASTVEGKAQTGQISFRHSPAGNAIPFSLNFPSRAELFPSADLTIVWLEGRPRESLPRIDCLAGHGIPMVGSPEVGLTFNKHSTQQSSLHMVAAGVGFCLHGMPKVAGVGFVLAARVLPSVVGDWFNCWRLKKSTSRNVDVDLFREECLPLLSFVMKMVYPTLVRHGVVVVFAPRAAEVGAGVASCALLACGSFVRGVVSLAASGGVSCRSFGDSEVNWLASTRPRVVDVVSAVEPARFQFSQCASEGVAYYATGSCVRVRLSWLWSLVSPVLVLLGC